MLNQVQIATNRIISYNWEDFVEDNGVILYYGLTSSNSSDGFLSSSAIVSGNTEVVRVAGSAGSATEDYDKLLSIPLVVKGTLFAIVKWGYGGSLPATNDSTLTVILKDYDGSSETIIASGSLTYSDSTSGTFLSNVSMPVPKTKIPSGHYLRMSVSVSTNGNNSGDDWGGFASDPLNAATAHFSSDTQLKFYIPLDLDN